MILSIILALFNGVIIGLSRVLNGQLSVTKGPLKASFYNHIVGFVLLSLLIFVFTNTEITITESTPSYVYLGGLLGAIYVAINSYILVKIGATNCAILVISGQMIAGVLLDNSTTVIDIAAIACIIFGVYLSKRGTTKKAIMHRKTSTTHNDKIPSLK